MLLRSTVFSLVVLVTAPAFAAEFYIVQDTQKQSCVISQEMPKDDAHAVVGDGAYGDEAAAAADMSKMLACNPRDASTGAPQSPTGARIQ
jgi:hypothetical protein